MMPPSLRVAAAKHVLGISKSQELQQAADTALDGGVYSEALGELATRRDAIMSEAGPLFEKALRELGMPLPGRDEAITTLLRYYLRAIAEERVPPYEGMQRLVLELYFPVISEEKGTRYVGDSRGIEHLYGSYWAYDDLRERPEEVSFAGKYGEEAVAALDAHIIELARDWLRERAGEG